MSCRLPTIRPPGIPLLMVIFTGFVWLSTLVFRQKLASSRVQIGFIWVYLALFFISKNEVKSHSNNGF